MYAATGIGASLSCPPACVSVYSMPVRPSRSPSLSLAAPLCSTPAYLPALLSRLASMSESFSNPCAHPRRSVAPKQARRSRRRHRQAGCALQPPSFSPDPIPRVPPLAAAHPPRHQRQGPSAAPPLQTHLSHLSTTLSHLVLFCPITRSPLLLLCALPKPPVQPTGFSLITVANGRESRQRARSSTRPSPSTTSQESTSRKRRSRDPPLWWPDALCRSGNLKRNLDKT